MTQAKRSVIAYGVVANIPGAAHLSERVRRIIYSIKDRVAFKLSRLKSLDFRNHESSASYNIGDQAIMRASLTAIRNVFPDIAVTTVNWMQLEAVHSQADALIICGSGYFALDENLKLPPRIEQDAAFVEKNNIPVVVYGVGVNLADAALSKKKLHLAPDQQIILRRLLRRCVHIGVRDEASRELLQAYTDLNIELIGDPALFIESKQKVLMRASPRQTMIGLNLPFHGLAVSRLMMKSLPLFIETFKEIQRVSGCHFQYMVHYDAEIVIANMLRDSGIKLSIIQGDVDALLKVYADLNLHIGGMLHSCILSASAGTPCVGLAYDIKHAGFFDVMRLPDFCVPMDPWPSRLIVHKVLSAISREHELRIHIQNRKNELQERANSFLKIAFDSISNETRKR